MFDERRSNDFAQRPKNDPSSTKEQRQLVQTHSGNLSVIYHDSKLLPLFPVLSRIALTYSGIHISLPERNQRGKESLRER